MPARYIVKYNSMKFYPIQRIKFSNFEYIPILLCPEFFSSFKIVALAATNNHQCMETIILTMISAYFQVPCIRGIFYYLLRQGFSL